MIEFTWVQRKRNQSTEPLTSFTHFCCLARSKERVLIEIKTRILKHKSTNSCVPEPRQTNRVSVSFSFLLLHPKTTGDHDEGEQCERERERERERETMIIKWDRTYAQQTSSIEWRERLYLHWSFYDRYTTGCVCSTLDVDVVWERNCMKMRRGNHKRSQNAMRASERVTGKSSSFPLVIASVPRWNRTSALFYIFE